MTKAVGQYNIRLTISIPPASADALKVIADATGETLSGVIARLIDREAKKRGVEK